MTKNTCPPLGVKSRTLAMLLAGLLLGGLAQAQESANASGGDATGSGGTAAYSIGQVVYATNTGNSGSVAQGVQQAYEIYVLGVQEIEMGISLTAFPNPTNDHLTLQISDFKNEKLSYECADAQGKLVGQGQLIAAQTVINMKGLPSAIYFVHVVNEENKQVQSFKIIKN
jgi:hypothetical protein